MTKALLASLLGSMGAATAVSAGTVIPLFWKNTNGNGTATKGQPGSPTSNAPVATKVDTNQVNDFLLTVSDQTTTLSGTKSSLFSGVVSPSQIGTAPFALIAGVSAEYEIQTTSDGSMSVVVTATAGNYTQTKAYNVDGFLIESAFNKNQNQSIIDNVIMSITDQKTLKDDELASTITVLDENGLGINDILLDSKTNMVITKVSHDDDKGEIHLTAKVTREGVSVDKAFMVYDFLTNAAAAVLTANKALITNLTNVPLTVGTGGLVTLPPGTAAPTIPSSVQLISTSNPSLLVQTGATGGAAPNVNAIVNNGVNIPALPTPSTVDHDALISELLKINDVDTEKTTVPTSVYQLNTTTTKDLGIEHRLTVPVAFNPVFTITEILDGKLKVLVVLTQGTAIESKEIYVNAFQTDEMHDLNENLGNITDKTTTKTNIDTSSFQTGQSYTMNEFGITPFVLTNGVSVTYKVLSANDGTLSVEVLLRKGTESITKTITVDGFMTQAAIAAKAVKDTLDSMLNIYVNDIPTNLPSPSIMPNVSVGALTTAQMLGIIPPSVLNNVITTFEVLKIDEANGEIEVKVKITLKGQEVSTSFNVIEYETAAEKIVRLDTKIINDYFHNITDKITTLITTEETDFAIGNTYTPQELGIIFQKPTNIDSFSIKIDDNTVDGELSTTFSLTKGTTTIDKSVKISGYQDQVTINNLALVQELTDTLLLFKDTTTTKNDTLSSTFALNQVETTSGLGIVNPQNIPSDVNVVLTVTDNSIVGKLTVSVSVSKNSITKESIFVVSEYKDSQDVTKYEYGSVVYDQRTEAVHQAQIDEGNKITDVTKWFLNGTSQTNEANAISQQKSEITSSHSQQSWTSGTKPADGNLAPGASTLNSAYSYNNNVYSTELQAQNAWLSNQTGTPSSDGSFSVSYDGTNIGTESIDSNSNFVHSTEAEIVAAQTQLLAWTKGQTTGSEGNQAGTPTAIPIADVLLDHATLGDSFTVDGKEYTNHHFAEVSNPLVSNGDYKDFGAVVEVEIDGVSGVIFNSASTASALSRFVSINETNGVIAEEFYDNESDWIDGLSNQRGVVPVLPEDRTATLAKTTMLLSATKTAELRTQLEALQNSGQSINYDKTGTNIMIRDTAYITYATWIRENIYRPYFENLKDRVNQSLDLGILFDESSTKEQLILELEKVGITRAQSTYAFVGSTFVDDFMSVLSCSDTNGFSLGEGGNLRRMLQPMSYLAGFDFSQMLGSSMVVSPWTLLSLPFYKHGSFAKAPMFGAPTFLGNAMVLQFDISTPFDLSKSPTSNRSFFKHGLNTANPTPEVAAMENIFNRANFNNFSKPLERYFGEKAAVVFDIGDKLITKITYFKVADSANGFWVGDTTDNLSLSNSELSVDINNSNAIEHLKSGGILPSNVETLPTDLYLASDGINLTTHKTSASGYVVEHDGWADENSNEVDLSVIFSNLYKNANEVYVSTIAQANTILETQESRVDAYTLEYNGVDTSITNDVNWVGYGNNDQGTKPSAPVVDSTKISVTNFTAFTPATTPDIKNIPSNTITTMSVNKVEYDKIVVGADNGVASSTVSAPSGGYTGFVYDSKYYSTIDLLIDAYIKDHPAEITSTTEKLSYKGKEYATEAAAIVAANLVADTLPVDKIVSVPITNTTPTTRMETISLFDIYSI